MKNGKQIYWLFIVLLASCVPAHAAYHHDGETDTPKFLSIYPGCAGTRLDSCALCHSGGTYQNEDSGQWITVGSCQWCHREEVYGYRGAGDIEQTLNGYGRDYRYHGRKEAAFTAIRDGDSDGDGYSNHEEITSLHFPGDPNDDPTKELAPANRITYTLEDIEQLPRHRQFMLMNTTRSGDFYAEYEGVTMEALLKDAGILETATAITVFAPDGYFYTHDLYPGGDYYPVLYTYPGAPFYYEAEADRLNGGWCDYSSLGCTGRSHAEMITVSGGLKLLLAYRRDGAYLVPAYLDETNRLGMDSEGPFRAVPPQMVPGPSDQSATHYNQNVCWPYDPSADHNGGYATRAVVAIRVEPLPEQTGDIDWYSAGWDYVDRGEVIVYGAIAGGSVSGRVCDNATGDPLSDSTVAADRGGYRFRTCSDGAYRITGMKPGTYTLTATASGYRSQSRQVDITRDTEQQADFFLEESPLTDCPVEYAVRTHEDVACLRKFKADVLAADRRGRGYIEMYYRHAPEVLGLLRSSARLRSSAKAVLLLAADALLNRQQRQNEPVLGDREVQLIEDLFNACAAVASRPLRAAVRELREDLRTGALQDMLGRGSSRKP